jgi:Xaa-Pro aminopeptidase
MNEELDEKTRRLTQMLDRTGHDALLINSQHNFAWLTGGGSNGVESTTQHGAAALAVTKHGQRLVIANRIELARMLDEEVREDEFEPLTFAWQGSMHDALRERIGGGVIATDLPMGDGFPVIEHEIAKCRASLMPQEIDRYRKLGADAGAVMRRVADAISPGMTELEIAARLNAELAAENITSIVTLVAADERISKYRHPTPTTNTWKNTLLLVTCARRHGLVASLSRMISSGDLSDELQHKTYAAAVVHSKLMDATRVGATSAELYRVASEAYAEQGFAGEIDLHHQGGAAGYRPRDWVAHPHGQDVVQPNQAFAWNPSITGTKVEETCILTDDGIHVITATEGFPQIGVTVNGRDYLSPGALVI